MTILRYTCVVRAQSPWFIARRALGSVYACLSVMPESSSPSSSWSDTSQFAALVLDIAHVPRNPAIPCGPGVLPLSTQVVVGSQGRAQTLSEQRSQRLRMQGHCCAIDASSPHLLVVQHHGTKGTIGDRLTTRGPGVSTKLVAAKSSSFVELASNPTMVPRQ